MERKIKIVITCFMFLMFFMVSLHSSNVKIVLAYSDVEFFPFQIGNGSTVANPPGLALDIISAAARELNYNVEFVRLPNRRVLLELTSGAVDGAFCFSFREDRLQMGSYPMRGNDLVSEYRITNVSYYLYRKKGSNVSWDGKEMRNLTGKIGANAGYSIVGDLRAMGIPIDEARTTEQNLEKLNADRISGYAAQDITTDFHVKTGKYGEIERLDVPLATKDYFVLLSRQFVEKNPRIAENFWKKLGEVRDPVIARRADLYKAN